MKILLVGNYPIDGQESMLRFGEMMRRELCKLGHDVRLLAPRAVLFPRVRRKDAGWKWVGYINKFVLFPLLLRREARSADVIHICDHSNAMYIPWLRGLANVITVHDLIAIRAGRGIDAPEPIGWTGRIFQRLILIGLSQTQRAICVSDHTRSQLVELVPALHARSFVVQSGQNFDFYPVSADECDAVRSRFGLSRDPYFLHVGQNHHRKNRTYLFQLLAALIAHRPALSNRLVLVGSPLSAGEVSVMKACGVENRISALGKVDGEDLRALYSGAQAMIFPSLLEGFGWPIIEAQACGCPVIASNRPPMNDIGGDAAIYIDPLDHRSSAAKIIAALSSLEGRREASIRNASRFSTKRMVGEYLFAYQAAQEATGKVGARESRLEFRQ